MQWTLRNGSVIDVNVKHKAECRLCAKEIYWAKFLDSTNTKAVPVELIFDASGVLVDVKMHFAVCTVIHEEKRKKASEPCKKCQKEQFSYSLYKDSSQSLHILRVCRGCNNSNYIPFTKENMDLVKK